MHKELLKPVQEQILQRLRRRLEEYARQASDDRSPCFPQVTSTIGLLGGRGAGKSTLLHHMYQHMSSSCDGGEWCDLRQSAVVVKPLDCSVLDNECEPGMAVLCHLAKELDSYWTRHGLKPNCDLQKRREELSGRYSRIGEVYQDLILELSSSPEDLGYYSANGLEERLALKQNLWKWLDDLWPTLARDCHKPSIVVVPLDDFDLVPVAETRRWMKALLDELNQPRLVFVLSADFYRLEHLSWDADDHLDDKTGRALLNKLLPTQNRIRLEGWEVTQRAQFRPYKPARQPQQQQRDASEECGLWERLQPFLQEHRLCRTVFQALLPAWPRGLESFYHALRGEDKPDQVPLAAVLHWLASARGEPLLAGRLEREQLHAWAGEMVLAEENLSPESWSRVVGNAVLRAIPLEAVDQPSPFPALDLPLQADKQAQTFPYAGHSDHHDPLRHELLYHHPLRDAQETERPLWCELLLDWELREHSHCRNRFLRDWKPAAERLRDAAFNFAGGREALTILLENNRALSRDVFAWLELTEPAGEMMPYRVGWAPLFSSLGGERNPTDPRLFNQLSFDMLHLRAKLSDEGEGECSTASILPDRVWALVLLSDALQRCPWPAFSAPSIWHAATYIGLAAGFVRSAYVYALRQVLPPPEGACSEVQQRFWKVLDQADPAQLLEKPAVGDWQELTEEQALFELEALFSDGLVNSVWLAAASQAEEAQSLQKALMHYLQSPAYRAAVALVGPLVARCRRKLAKQDAQGA